jgi:outer membrane protein
MNQESFNNKEGQQEIAPVNFTPQQQPGKPWQLFFNAVILAGMAVMIILYFGNMRKSSQLPESRNSQPLNMSFAYVNTDSVWTKYVFVDDVKQELAAFETKLQNQYNASIAAFQNEYNEYIKKGTAGLLSLDEQKKTEEKLSQKQQALAELDQKLTAQLMEEKERRNREVHDSIVNYIQRYNKTKNYTFILEKSYGGGLLFVNDSLDITPQIVEGLNREYRKFKPKSNSAEK